MFASAQAYQPVQQDTTGISALLNSITKSENDTSLVLIADVSVHGNKKTKPYIVDREIPFKQGQYIRYNELKQLLTLAQQQVTNTALFTTVAAYIYKRQNDLVFINIDVKERWYLFPLPYFKLVDRNFNQWWVEQKASLNRTNYGIKFMQNNVSGRNDKLAINLISGYSNQVQAKYEQPFADNSLKRGFSVAFNFSRQRELNFRTDQSKQAFYKQDKFVMQGIRAEVAYLYRPAIKTRHSLKLAYVNNRINDTIIQLNPNYYPGSKSLISYPELSYTVQYFNADYNAYPTKGFIADASIIRKGFFNSAMNLTQLQYHTNYTVPVTKKMQLYLQSSGIIKFPFDQPFVNQQLFGYGDAYLRGLEYYVTDGVAGIMSRVTFRREIFSTTLRTPPETKKTISIPLRFFIKAGEDLGYTYSKTPGNSLLSNKFLYTECFGVDVVIPSYDIVLKFEYSFNQLGGNGLFFHVRTDF
ncbi:POTRA domain-containing protein [Panacibacter ginsenosidivorans]|nr:POTRA domain-containing protein [Panacibacter ginsenosidivorans]